MLRRETPDPSVYPVQAPGLDVEIEIQYRAMSSLARARRCRSRRSIGYERDAAVLGAPFFVMGFVDGQVPTENPPYASAGFFAEATPEERRRMIEDGLAVLAEIHAVDWRAAGLRLAGGAGPDAGRARAARALGALRRARAGRPRASAARARPRLAARAPAARVAARPLVGRPAPRQHDLADFRCACVTDFENVAIAPPEYDLGWWLMFDRWTHECFGVPRLPGEPTRDEQRGATRAAPDAPSPTPPGTRSSPRRATARSWCA